MHAMRTGVYYAIINMYNDRIPPTVRGIYTYAETCFYLRRWFAEWSIASSHRQELLHDK